MLAVTDDLTSDQAALVFRRAAELDARSQRGEPGTLDLAAIEQAGLEAGLSRDAIRQAVAEIRAGSVGDLAVRSDAVVARTVDMAADDLEDEVDRFMRRQKFRVLRRKGGCTIWEPDRGLVASISRSIDFNKRIVLRETLRPTTCVVPIPGDDGRSHVRFELDMRRARRGWYVLPVVLGALGATAVGAAAVVGTPIEVVLGAPAAAAAAGGGYAGARVGYRSGRDRTITAIEGFLDTLDDS
jgi:hypothetical protein